MQLLPLCFVSAILISLCHAYGSYGHELTGSIAQSLLPASVLEEIYSFLPSGEKSLEHAATWADRVKSSGRYDWSRHLHYINAHDDPPAYCKALEHSDCPAKGCIISALFNATRIISQRERNGDRKGGESESLFTFTFTPLHQSSSSYRRTSTFLEVQESILFLVHLMGDLHQPLHFLSLQRGGNGIRVKFGGKWTRLHAVWDSALIQKRIWLDHGRSKEAYFASMKKRVLAGTWKDSFICNKMNKDENDEDNEEEMSRVFYSNPLLLPPVLDDNSQHDTDWFCPLVWANQVARMNCNGTLDFAPEQDLALSPYYDENIVKTESLLALAGMRMASILLHLFQN